MKFTNGTLNNKKYCCIADKGPQYLLIQPMFEEELKDLEAEVQEIKSRTDVPFAITAFGIRNWNKELSPWLAPAVFGKEDFGEGAADTLGFIEKELVPEVIIELDLDPGIPMILGGYSLAGLFALWCACGSRSFDGIAGVSPSVWFPGFIDLVRREGLHADSLYLSLGDREEKTKNKVMCTVGDCIRELHIIADEEPEVRCSVLAWNEGNHFKDPGKRTAKGFAWCLQSLQERLSADVASTTHD